MATYRDNPYQNFNFLVALGAAQGSGDEGTVVGGFSEVRGLGLRVAVSEYRNGNERTNTVRKLPGLTSFDDVVLRRGLIGSLDLFQWIKGISQGEADRRTVTITLLDEARNPVMFWKLHNAWPVKYSGPDFNAQGNDVAIEELVLTHEGLDIE